MNKIIIEIITFIVASLFTFFIVNGKRSIKEWLLYAVIEAEKSLGNKTGELKLRYVYDEFLFTYPVISKIIPFNGFKKLVDTALFSMEELLNENIKIKKFVKGEN